MSRMIKLGLDARSRQPGANWQRRIRCCFYAYDGEMQKKVPTSEPVATGLEYLRLLLIGASHVNVRSREYFKSSKDDCKMIGTGMSALYQAATCHRKCYEGSHVFESICGRAYNLACGSFVLALDGLYDEAASLIRSIGEIANLVSLSAWDPQLFQQWLTSDEKTRKREFSPVKVRLALEAKKRPLVADENWYSHLSEKFTHITPHTVPGMHDNPGHGFVGLVYQPEGLKFVLENLATVIGSLSMLVCKFANFDDLFAELNTILDEMRGDSMRKSRGKPNL